MQLDNGLDERAKRNQLQKERRHAFSKKLIEEAHNKDCQSYSKDVITVEEQARREPDFIGRHWVYNLNAQSVKKFIPGTYALAFARPYGKLVNKHGESLVQIFTPNIHFDTLLLVTQPIHRNLHPQAHTVNKHLEHGDWGVIFLRIAGRTSIIRFCREHPANPSLVGVRIEHYDPDHQHRTMNRGLQNVLDFHIDDERSTVEFGYRETGFSENTNYGFHFMRLNLSVYDERRGLDYVHTIVAVKMPGKEMPGKGDWASGFVLKQPCNLPHQVENHVVKRQSPRRAKKQVEDDPDKTPTKANKRKKSVVIDLTDEDGGVGLGILA